MKDRETIEALLGIMARLRDPASGCPWDLAQDFRSILPFTLEEAYEVAEAIEQDDLSALRDELGDLLLQVVFHARLAEEAGAFDFADVVTAICAKLVRRHPHVFGAERVADADAVRATWEQHKAAERAARREGAAGVLAGVAQALPALVRAEKLQRRAARVGFDWEAVEGVFAKVAEELAECREAHAGQSRAALEHELGDLLFAAVNLARHLGLDAEQTLRAANARFERRFAGVEAILQARGLAPSRDCRAAMEDAWEAVKAAERAAADAPAAVTAVDSGDVAV